VCVCVCVYVCMCVCVCVYLCVSVCVRERESMRGYHGDAVEEGVFDFLSFTRQLRCQYHSLLKRRLSPPSARE
jgi:hypothetical protein